ncbi:hypothetical protein Tco_1040301 [Tanacetum coccineum]
MTGGLKLFFLTVLGVTIVVTSIFSLSTISSINVRSGLRDEFTKLSTAGEVVVEEAALYPSPVLNLSTT